MQRPERAWCPHDFLLRITQGAALFVVALTQVLGLVNTTASASGGLSPPSPISVPAYSPSGLASNGLYSPDHSYTSADSSSVVLRIMHLLFLPTLTFLATSVALPSASLVPVSILFGALILEVIVYITELVRLSKNSFKDLPTPNTTQNCPSLPKTLRVCEVVTKTAAALVVALFLAGAVVLAIEYRLGSGL